MAAIVTLVVILAMTMKVNSEWAGNPAGSSCKLYFDQAQRNVNEMADLLHKTGPEGQEKIRRAMLALADAIYGAAGGKK